ncbi:hypothetical protein PIIN_03320 [Serendipita indica DSM 11827]|uniref:DUF7704 domain-containing protein n=1 Tax=Serendipita indica (strain DSM 11827) TaxID=1109443 RepID=G4TDL6_SERID|nr:hypothetical protein PIIN_03320 [Serendipita indica DSM 11827]
MAAPFPALTGFYKLLFLYIEPALTIIPAFIIGFYPGAVWFHNELALGSKPILNLEPGARMAFWQLASCYGLIGMISSLVLRTARDAIKHDPAAQERVVGSLLVALAIADLIHIAVTVLATPIEILTNPSVWNGAFIGNVPFTLFLFASRFAWFQGLGRKAYYYSVKVKTQ